MATARTSGTATKATTTQKKVIVEEKPIVAAPKKPAVKKFEKDELIPCRSNTNGQLLYNGAKSGIPYSWSGMGDMTYVEYQDLLAAMVMRSSYIYDPLFIIEDEDVLADPKWIEVKKLYENIEDTINIQEVLELPMNKFRKVLSESPRGVLNAIKTTVASQIDAGTFDSYTKVKIIDEICGTDLKLLLE